MKVIHKNLALGRWQRLSLCEQMGNIGSEVSRVLHWQNKDQNNFEKGIERTLELFELTLQDSRWKGQKGHLREIGRVREVFLDAIFGGKEYKTSLKDLEHYFFYFAYCARQEIDNSLER